MDTHRKGVPSVASIMRYLGDGLRHEFGDNAIVKARTIRRIMQTTPRRDIAVQESMRAINEVLNAHGVEFTAQDPYGFDARSMGEHFEYVNMGDTYTPTVIYHRGKFKLGSWGDLLESLERRGKKFR